ncbi:hypothetical protein [Nitrosospira multiformis]|uniref:hypothetical protein n=1 Tax=Nitrosospira multiformis TaxID=1231 RepID=UPI000896C576|nr:hypothetical protein [Nitrosospira multiformis]SDZ73188.1 hypothetical protein SAMN05216411_10171 [Nitrosospira multiformis]
MNAYFQAHKSRVTVWKLLYGSMERGIGAPRMQMELLLRAVRRSTGTAGAASKQKL